MGYDIADVQQQVQSSIRERHFIGNYEIVRKIGEGTFSSVFLAKHIMTRHEVVLKGTEKNQTNLASEIANMSLLYHPHIVRLYEYIVMPDKVWLVLEYCGGEELFSYLVRSRVIPPQQACQFFAQLAGAVAYAHQKNCAHRDLKLENVLLDENGVIKLGDFGFTRNYVPRTMLETVCGTESYMAPELLLRKKYHPEAADVWSLGVILYAMIYGQFPFDDDNVASTNQKVVEEDPPFPAVEGGEYLVEMTRKILTKDPRKRPTVAQILDSLGESGKQQQALLLKLEAHPEISHVFTSKEERAVLKGMKVLNIDLHAVASSVVNHKCDPLHGLWYTALDRQRFLKKQHDGPTDVSLHRRKSKASIHSARPFIARTISRSSQKSPSRQSSVTKNSVRAMSLASTVEFPTMEYPQRGNSVDTNRDFFAEPSRAPSSSVLGRDVENSGGSATSSTITNGASTATPGGSLFSSGDRTTLGDRGIGGKPKRAFEKLWTALKWKRNGDKNTLIAYYRPSLEGESRPPLSTYSIRNAKSHSPEGDSANTRLNSPLGTSLRDPSPIQDSPVLDLGSKTFTYTNGRQSSLSVSSTSSAPLAETPIRRGAGQLQGTQQPYLAAGEDQVPLQQPSQPSLVSSVAQSSGPSVMSNGSNQSQGSSSSPFQTQNGFSSMQSPSHISRPMSTYSEMSSLSQISESSVDASQLLSDVQESPKNSKQANASQRWRSFANAGLVKSNGREAVAPGSVSTPPGTATMRQRVRMLSLRERIPQKIDESEGEGNE